MLCFLRRMSRDLLKRRWRYGKANEECNYARFYRKRAPLFIIQQTFVRPWCCEEACHCFFVPLTIGAVYGFFALLENVCLKILLSVLVGGLTSAPIWINLLSLKTSFREQKLLQNGDFDIVVCEVQYKDEKLVHRHTEKISPL